MLYILKGIHTPAYLKLCRFAVGKAGLFLLKKKKKSVYCLECVIELHHAFKKKRKKKKSNNNNKKIHAMFNTKLRVVEKGKHLGENSSK